MATGTLDARQVVEKATNLKRFWDKRNKRFTDWYGQIQMIDRLAQKDMESFVGNDPRAAFNLLTSMLDQTIPHRISPELLTIEQIQPAAELSRLYDIAWEDVYSSYRKRGRYFQRDLIGYLLATGWYSVFASISMDGLTCVAEVWNPATVFPAWDDVLSECAHIFIVSESQARRMAMRNKWSVSRFVDKTPIYDLWWIDDAGKVNNAIVLGNDLVKKSTVETRFNRIPVFISPVGGLPDTGDISKSAEAWKGEIGQSFIATNENIYNTWNKWWTFMLQLLRDTAQARTFEKTRSAKQIVQPENWNKRGAHFKLGIEDSIGFIPPPQIPVDLRSAQLDMEAMMQRGGPSWAMYGGVQAQMTAYVMSQVVSSVNQAARAFHRGVIDCITDIDNFWFYLMQTSGYKPYGLGIPSGLAETTKITAEYELRIPGDLTQRATTARMLCPTFELSDERIMEELFPEIKNPMEEVAKVRASKARQNPIYAQISLIEALKQEAILLTSAKDADGAALYEKAAARLEQEITGASAQGAPAAQPGQPTQSTQPTQPTRVRPQPGVVPPGGSEPITAQAGG